MFSKPGFGSNLNVDHGFEAPAATARLCFVSFFINFLVVYPSFVCTMSEGKQSTNNMFSTSGTILILMRAIMFSIVLKTEKQGEIDFEWCIQPFFLASPGNHSRV